MQFIKSICKVCGLNAIRIATCGETQEHFFVICEECESIWTNPELNGEPYFLQGDDPKCPYGNHTIDIMRYANIDEIQKIGWSPHLEDSST